MEVPRVRTCFGTRTFAVAAPTIWNSLPLHMRNSPSICCFRRQLKTFFYNLVLCHLSPHHTHHKLYKKRSSVKVWSSFFSERMLISGTACQIVLTSGLLPVLHVSIKLVNFSEYLRCF